MTVASFHVALAVGRTDDAWKCKLRPCAACGSRPRPTGCGTITGFASRLSQATEMEDGPMKTACMSALLFIHLLVTSAFAQVERIWLTHRSHDPSPTSPASEENLTGGADFPSFLGGERA